MFTSQKMNLNSKKERRECLRQMNRAAIQEINRHRWLQSEKVGYDIGLSSASHDWIERYYDAWLSLFLKKQSPPAAAH